MAVIPIGQQAPFAVPGVRPDLMQPQQPGFGQQAMLRGLGGLAQGFLGASQQPGARLGTALLGGAAGLLPGLAQGAQLEQRQRNIETEQKRLQQQATARQALQQQQLGLQQRQQRLRESEFGEAQRSRLAARQFAGTLEPQTPEQMIAKRNAELTGSLSGLASAFGTDQAPKLQTFGNAQLGFHAFNPQTGETAELVAPKDVGASGKDIADIALKMRKQISASPALGGYQASLPTFQSAIKSAQLNTRAGDLDVIQAIAKILDPTSVTREGEIDTVRMAAGPAQQLLGFLNAVQGGSALSPQQRQDLLQIGTNRLGALRENAVTNAAEFESIADLAGVPREMAIPGIEPLPTVPQIAGAQSAGLIGQAQAGGGPAGFTESAVNPATGQTIFLVNGQWVDQQGAPFGQ